MVQNRFLVVSIPTSRFLVVSKSILMSGIVDSLLIYSTRDENELSAIKKELIKTIVGWSSGMGEVLEVSRII